MGPGWAAVTELVTGAGFGLGVAARPEVEGESGSVAGTGPEPGDGLGFGSGAEAGFGPESEPEAATEPGVVVGPEAVAEPGAGVGFAPVFEVELVPVGGTEVVPLTGAGSGLGSGHGAGARFGFGTETAPEVEFERVAVLGLGLVAEFVAETELGPGGGFGLVLEPGDAAFVGLGRGAGPESVHKFGLELGAEVECGLGAGAEVGWVSW